MVRQGMMVLVMAASVMFGPSRVMVASPVDSVILRSATTRPVVAPARDGAPSTSIA